MVFVSRGDGLKREIKSKKWLFFTTTLGFAFLLISFLFIFIDPIFMIAKYYIRIANGTMIHNIMMNRIYGPKFYVNLFNITNAAEFISGKHSKIRLNEVGPFVYQEYRLNYDLTIDSEANLMKFTPTVWAEFVPEESLADPKDVYLMMPNLPLLAGVNIISKYPFFVRSIFNTYASNVQYKAVKNMTAHDYLWGYEDPMIELSNTIVPGIFYFNSIGLLERLYDSEANYTMEIGTSDEEKFSVKRVTKRYRYQNKNKPSDILEKVQTFVDSYEGGAFPPDMTPEMPINIYRYGVCKVFKIQYTGTATTKYGSEGFVYDIGNNTFNDHQMCDSKGWCPGGLMNIGSCYGNFNFALSRGHYLDADPRILDRLEGIKPDKKLHYSEFIMDPKIGVPITARISLQLSMVLGDVNFNRETKSFSDLIFPICHSIITHPKLPPQAEVALVVLHTYGPYILIAVEIICVLLGLGFLYYSFRMFYLKCLESPSIILESSVDINSYGYIPVNMW